MRLLTWCKKLRIRKPALPKRMASDVVDLAGVGCLVGAAWWWQPTVGLVALGGALLLVGWVMDR
jgi:hypothetical protein